MRIIRGFGKVKPLKEGCVATIGNFDGVHLGHRAVIENLATHAQGLGLPILVILFEPQPLEFFQPSKAPPCLTRFREKIVQLTKLPVDAVLLLRFNRNFAALTAEHFIRDVLVERLHIRHLVVGDDFRFGKGRQGDYRMLSEAGLIHGFTLEDTPSFEMDGSRVSSTGIREALESARLEKAEQWLGRPYSVCGRIIHGNKKGRSIGFPTANIQLHRNTLAVQGVFAVTMKGIDNKIVPGVANVGIRPTVGGGGEALLEVHLFDFNEDIYGAYVEVFFHRKIRDEMKFASFDALKKQIGRDAAKAREIVQTTKNALI